MQIDAERCVRAVQSKDARFDGWFFTAVVTTGIYCRPSCPVRPPKVSNMRFYPSSAAAQQAGFRACKRCRPDASPGSPEWHQRADVVARAMRLIADGVVDRDGVPGLADHLGYSTRQVERHLQAELGAGPLALARAQRAQTARLLIETTGLPMTEASLAAGFSSIRSFNDTIREVFAASPTDLRRRAAKGQPPRRAPGSPLPATPATLGTAATPATLPLHLRLPFRAPLCPDNLFGHLAASAVPGVEEWRDGAYRRTLRLPHGHAIVALAPAPEHVECHLMLSDLRDLAVAISRCRRLLDLDADPVAVDEQLRLDPVLAEAVAKTPGRRVPRSVDPEEMAVRAVLGQQVSAAAARTHAARLVAAHGDPITDPDGGLTHLWPAPAALADLDPGPVALPRARRATLIGLVTALAEGRLDLGPAADWDRARSQLQALAGFGPWTVEIVAMRALGDPDAFPATDLGVIRGAAALGLDAGPTPLTSRAAAWRPWRAYAVQHLWATSTARPGSRSPRLHSINRIPPPIHREEP